MFDGQDGLYTRRAQKNELFGGDQETMGGGGAPVASAP